jgi:hypothetical protein
MTEQFFVIEVLTTIESGSMWQELTCADDSVIAEYCQISGLQSFRFSMLSNKTVV